MARSEAYCDDVCDDAETLRGSDDYQEDSSVQRLRQLIDNGQPGRLTGQGKCAPGLRTSGSGRRAMLPDGASTAAGDPKQCSVG
jgi:hypothetical protein